MTTVRCDVTGGVGWITLDRPDRMNAVNVELATALGAAIGGLGERPDVNVIVIRGAGGNFCAGGDFDEVQRLRAEGTTALRGLFTAFKTACDQIARVAVPVIAAVEGVAMAGGFELMQAADIVLVTREARIADNHINFGMIPGGGSTARLPRILGRQRALGLLLSGDKIGGEQAVQLGLAYRAYPADTFDESVQAFATRLAGRDRAATTAIKQLVNHGLDNDFHTADSDETDAVVAHIAGQAGRSGVSAFKNREVRT
ncbi:enoyl-CoA hydratase/isomerase family protein [Mycolicibacterium sp. J2]|uniref:enoyl-CoA hydratase/isomerase family protein n=1 Tax=Mycolicibacterium sp. J2 TaxID=2993511 RepID=UPI00224A50AF|nr:enoyl-CoA hydratase/isomerase family protein [Mycolicibacterium sp. J2]MCX2715442.1 enoyl-CoA hydratase/isomerase family protein [Mycolicibacterium sp. J2]